MKDTQNHLVKAKGNSKLLGQHRAMLHDNNMVYQNNGMQNQLIMQQMP